MSQSSIHQTIIEISRDLNLFRDGNSVDYHLARAQQPYLTTNYIVAVGPYVFKRYRSARSFFTEQVVYAHRKYWTFDLPGLIGPYTSGDSENWLVFSRAAGRSVMQFSESGGDLRVVVEKIVSALSEFEKKATTLPNISFERKMWSDSFDPLQEILRSSRRNEYSDAFSDLTELADSSMGTTPYVPCFDAYHDNMLITEALNSESHLRIVFFDFDKAWSLVPLGEQLSHIAALPLTAPWTEYAIELYAAHHAVSILDVRRVVSVSVFLRAMSGIRDALKWRIAAENNVETDAIRKRRLTIFSGCLAVARASLDSLARALRISLRQRDVIVALLSWLEHTQSEDRSA